MPPPSSRPQAFLKVYEGLRDQIVNDPFLAGQPDAAKEWMKKVRESERRAPRRRLILAASSPCKHAPSSPEPD